MASTAETTATSEGPVLSVINKRLRALRKKLNRITQMEESLAQGKTLNKEQEETLRSKPSVLAAVDELEKLWVPLQQAVAQEIELSTSQKQEQNAAETPETKDSNGGVSDLLKLLYFASVFDVKTLMEARDNMLTRIHERNCCLTYDYVTDDDADFEPLKEGDLDVIAQLGGLLLSRPSGSSLSHQDALEKCAERAKLWVESSREEIDPGSGVTYAGLREKLNKIMASDYFTTTPEIKAPVEVAAAGNYASFQVISPVGETLQVEDSVSDYQQTDDQSPESHETQYADETEPVEEHQQGVQEIENNTSEVKVQPETAVHNDSEIDRDPRESDLKENYPTNHRYNQSYYRGGRGRRGFNGGRGGRGGMGRGNYQNGRSGGQFYDQPGGHYQRNYSYRGRGGRGMGGNYKFYGHAGNVEVASSS